MSEINIKQATAIDLEVLVKIGRETFAETFSSENSQQDLENYLNTSFTNEKLLSEIAHPSSQFYIAWNENTPIGYLKINTDASPVLAGTCKAQLPPAPTRVLCWPP